MYVDNINYDNLLFIHIPKTAGQSIFSALKTKYEDNWIRTVYANHDPLFVLEKNNIIGSRTYKFTVVRNPFRRTFSYYKHFNKINDTNHSFEKFLYFIKYGDFFEKTPMIPYSQSFFCLNTQGDIAANKIYKYENLIHLEKDLKISLPHLNNGNYSEQEYFESYSEQNKSFVRDYYSSDFYNFNYCFDFV